MDSPTSKDHNLGKTPPQPSGIAGFQKVYPNERDDNLPEVYVDDSPQALPIPETHQTEAESDVTSPKISVADTLNTSPGNGRSPSSDGGKDGTAQKEARVCGMRRKWFFIALGVVLVIVIAAAVGGGVGGAVASRASGDGAGDGDASQNDETPSPTSVSGSSS